MKKKRGIVNARNKFLKKLKKVIPNFICFFDDDCIVDKYWLKNAIKHNPNENIGVWDFGMSSVMREKYKINILMCGYQYHYQKIHHQVGFINYMLL